MQPIRFEEDLYFLNDLLNALEGGLALKLDRQFFFDKIVEDIFFLDTTINKLYTALSDNFKMVQVSQIMRSMQTTKLRFTALIDKILSGTTGLDEAFVPFSSKLQDLRSAHTIDIQQIYESYLKDEPSHTPKEGISHEEYEFLFPDEEDAP